jgi:signal transduction histidine kinase/DNA-binding response OmpR family regulator
MIRILVVDDEEIICKRLKGLLELDNYLVCIAADGRQALQVFRQQKPEIALVDIKLPGMDGIELLTHLKQLDERLEVIMFTGHGGVDTAIKAMKLGAFSYIQKPIEYDELVIEIKRALAKQEMQRRLDSYVKSLEQAIEAKNKEIAERKKAEERIGEQSAFLHNVLESLTHPFYVLNVDDYTITIANSATNIDSENPKNTCYMLTHRRKKPCGGGKGICPLREVKKTKMPVVVEHIHDQDDGSKKYVEVHAFPILDEQDRVKQIIAYVIDITARKRAEELERAKAVAEQANRIKTQFLANVSHEIRTPLNAIIGFSELLKNTQVTATQADYITTLQQSGKDLRHLIDDILDIAKIETHKLKMESIAFNLKDLIENIVKTSGRSINSKKVAFSFTYARGLPLYFTGDPARIKQIIVNLLDNAIKFTEKGRIELKVQGVQSFEKKTQFRGSERKHYQKNIGAKKYKLTISVKDTGIGIPPAKQSEIFLPFMRVDNIPARKYEGAGLGLHITKVLMEKLGGTVTLKSEQGKGSEFSVCLELGTSKPPIKNKAKEFKSSKHTEKRNKDKPAAPKTCRGGSIKDLRILVAEDSPVNQKLLKIQLENYGCQVELASNGREALEKIKNKDFDLCLMDVQMPVIDGIAATKTIRESLRKNLPIIALTASAMKGDEQKCLDSGMNDFIAKPIDQEILKEKIRKLVD